MASGGKRKTTMAKLNREARLREKRLDKQARKEARRNAPADDWLGAPVAPAEGEPALPDAAGPDTADTADPPAEAQPEDQGER